MSWRSATAYCTLALWVVACSDGTGPEDCIGGVQFSGSICLDVSEAEELGPHRALIETEVERTLDAVQPLLGLTDLRISVVADPTRVIPEVGLGGYNPSASEVLIFADPDLPDLEAVLQAELLPMLAHEIHHAMRRRAVGYGSTLFEAAISEGLADHFSIEVSGRAPPPWATALTPEELEQWLPEVVSRTSGTYNHAEWFLGSGSIPRWTGYAVGFELVRQYLARNPGERPSSLVGEPAAAFLPPASEPLAQACQAGVPQVVTPTMSRHSFRDARDSPKV